MLFLAMEFVQGCTLVEMARNWPFFRILLDDLDMVLAKSDQRIAARYVELVEDKKTGKRVGAVVIPRAGGYGLMTYLHNGKQYIVIPTNGGYTAMALVLRSVS